MAQRSLHLHIHLDFFALRNHSSQVQAKRRHISRVNAAYYSVRFTDQQSQNVLCDGRLFFAHIRRLYYRLKPPVVLLDP